MNDTTALTGPFVIALLGLGLGIVLVRLAAIERRLNRMSRLEGKLDALLKHPGISFDPFEDIPPGVRDAIEDGETILAIRRYREATGVGLKEAKDAVDELRARAVPST